MEPFGADNRGPDAMITHKLGGAKPIPGGPLEPDH